MVESSHESSNNLSLESNPELGADNRQGDMASPWIDAIHTAENPRDLSAHFLALGNEEVKFTPEERSSIEEALVEKWRELLSTANSLGDVEQFKEAFLRASAVMSPEHLKLLVIDFRKSVGELALALTAIMKEVAESASTTPDADESQLELTTQEKEELHEWETNLNTLIAQYGQRKGAALAQTHTKLAEILSDPLTQLQVAQEKMLHDNHRTIIESAVDGSELTTYTVEGLLPTKSFLSPEKYQDLEDALFQKWQKLVCEIESLNVSLEGFKKTLKF